MPTALTCGHFLCYRCVQSQWANPNSGNASVFCKECAAPVQISTFKRPHLSQGQANGGGASEGPVQVIRQASCAGDGGVDTLPADRAAGAEQIIQAGSSNTGKRSLTGQAHAPGSSGERRDDMLGQTHLTPLAADQAPHQDDAWRLQNDEGFIRDWIVANVPDHVIFKMVGGGSQDGSSVPSADSYGSGECSGSVVSALSRAASGTAPAPGNLMLGTGAPLPGMSSFLERSYPKQTPQVWGHVISRSASKEHSQDMQLKTDHVIAQPQLLEHKGHRSASLEKQDSSDSERAEGEPLSLTPQTAHGSPAPSISGIFPHHTKEDIENIIRAVRIGDSGDCVLDVSSRPQRSLETSLLVSEERPQCLTPPAVPAINVNPLIDGEEQRVSREPRGSAQHASISTQTAVSSTYSRVPSGCPGALQRDYGCTVPRGMPLYRPHKAALFSGRQYHTPCQEHLWDRASASALSPAHYQSLRNYGYTDLAMGRPARRMRPGIYYPYAYPYTCSYSNQPSSSQYYQQNVGWPLRHSVDFDPDYSNGCRQRTRGWRTRCSATATSCRASSPCPWNSRAYAANVNISPIGKVHAPPHLQVVQVLRHKPDTNSEAESADSEITAQSQKCSVEGRERGPVHPASQTEAEVALMQTRAMPSGKKVEDIYVVPQVWLCDRADGFAQGNGVSLQSQNLQCNTGADIAGKEQALSDMQIPDVENGQIVDDIELQEEIVHGFLQPADQDCEESLLDMMAPQASGDKTITPTDFTHSGFHAVAYVTADHSATPPKSEGTECGGAPVMRMETHSFTEQESSRLRKDNSETHGKEAGSWRVNSMFTVEAGKLKEIHVNAAGIHQPSVTTVSTLQPCHIEETESTISDHQATRDYVVEENVMPAGSSRTPTATATSTVILSGEEGAALIPTPAFAKKDIHLCSAALQNVTDEGHLDYEHITPSETVPQIPVLSQQTVDVRLSGDVQILEHSSTCPSQILLSLQNPAQSQHKPQYRRNLQNAFHGLTRVATTYSDIASRGHACFGRGRTRCGRRGRFRPVPYFHQDHSHIQTADTFAGVNQYFPQQAQSVYGHTDGYFMQTVHMHPSAQTMLFSQPCTSQPSSLPEGHSSQQMCSQQPHNVHLGTSTTVVPAKRYPHLSTSIPFGSSIDQQYPYQLQSPWMGDSGLFSQPLTDPYPHLYVSSARTQTSGKSSFLASAATQNYKCPPQQPSILSSSSCSEATRTSASTAPAQGSVYAQRHLDNISVVQNKDTHDTCERNKSYFEVSAFGDMGQMQLQRYLDAAAGHTDSDSSSVQWLLGQVTQLNEKMSDSPGLHQLLSCLMLLSAVRGHTQDSSQPVDPGICQQAQASNMDCLFKSILGLGYDVICCGRAVCAGDGGDNCQDVDGTGVKSTEIICLVKGWFKCVVQQMTQMISIYLDKLCVKDSKSSTPVKGSNQSAQTSSLIAQTSDVAPMIFQKDIGETAITMSSTQLHINSEGVSTVCVSAACEKEQSSSPSADSLHLAPTTNTTTVEDGHGYTSHTSGDVSRGQTELICHLADGSFVNTAPLSDAETTSLCTMSVSTGTYQTPTTTEKVFGASLSHERVLLQNVHGGISSLKSTNSRSFSCVCLEQKDDWGRNSESTAVSMSYAQGTNTQTPYQDENTPPCTDSAVISACPVSVTLVPSIALKSVGQIDDSKRAYESNKDVMDVCQTLVASVITLVGGEQGQKRGGPLQEKCRTTEQSSTESAGLSPLPVSEAFSSTDSTGCTVCTQSPFNQELTPSAGLVLKEESEMDIFISPQNVISDTAIIMSETVEVETEESMDVDNGPQQQQVDEVAQDIKQNPGEDTKDSMSQHTNLENASVSLMNQPQDKSEKQLELETESGGINGEQPTGYSLRLRSRRFAWKSLAADDLSPERTRSLRSRKRTSSRKSCSIQTF